MEGVYGWKIRRYNKKCKKTMLYSSNDTYTIIITAITVTIIFTSSSMNIEVHGKPTG